MRLTAERHAYPGPCGLAASARERLPLYLWTNESFENE